MKEYDLVRTLVDKEGFKKGSKGIVVAFYLDGKGVDVEIQDDNNHPLDVATYEIDEIELWNKEYCSVPEYNLKASVKRDYIFL